MTGNETRDAVLRAVAVIGLTGVALAGSLAAGAWSRTRPPPHLVGDRSRAAA